MVNNPAAISAVGAWAMNVFSSVGIIMVNKQVMSVYGFKFATTLTGMHFAVTGLTGAIASVLGYLSSKTAVPLWELAWFSVVANLSIVGMNLSLMLNTVGFYQIAKLSIIPTVCLLESLINNKSYSKEIKFSVVVVMLGVGVCTVTDLTIQGFGFLAAVVAVVATSLQQIFIGSLQKKYNIGSFDLLSQTAPIQAASLLLIGPVCDYFLTTKSILQYDFKIVAMVFILLSCLLAVVCNLSQYLCIGKFSATSFQVLGHMKTVLVLVLGWVLFDSKLTVKNLAGMLMAVIGMVLYSWAVEKGKKEQKEKEEKANAESSISRNSSFSEDTAPLIANKDVEMGKSNEA